MHLDNVCIDVVHDLISNMHLILTDLFFSLIHIIKLHIHFSFHASFPRQTDKENYIENSHLFDPLTLEKVYLILSIIIL